MGGCGALLLLACLACLVTWNRETYRFRAHKRLIEDYVHSLVLGEMRSQHVHRGSSKREGLNDEEVQVITRERS